MSRDFSFLLGHLYPTGQLVFMLLGSPDILQPLDRPVVGVFKAHARELSRTQYHETHGAKTMCGMMARHFGVSWGRITPEAESGNRHQMSPMEVTANSVHTPGWKMLMISSGVKTAFDG